MRVRAAWASWGVDARTELSPYFETLGYLAHVELDVSDTAAPEVRRLAGEELRRRSRARMDLRQGERTAWSTGATAHIWIDATARTLCGIATDANWRILRSDEEPYYGWSRAHETFHGRRCKRCERASLELPEAS